VWRRGKHEWEAGVGEMVGREAGWRDVAVFTFVQFDSLYRVEDMAFGRERG
jgi:hypothetical protein